MPISVRDVDRPEGRFESRFAGGPTRMIRAVGRDVDDDDDRVALDIEPRRVHRGFIRRLARKHMRRGRALGRIARRRR